MKTVMFSVYDNKARAYCTPFFCQTEEVAMRVFAAAANDPSHPVSQNPEDYTLVVIATFDDDTGAVAVKPHILQLGMAISFQKEPSDFVKHHFGVISKEVENVR